MSRARIDIKGTSYGLVIQIGPGDWNSLLAELTSRLEQTPAFFKGGRVALNVGPRQLTGTELRHVGELLQEHQMSLWAVISESDVTREETLALGLETTLSSSQGLRPHAETLEQGGSAGPDEHNAILVRRTLRSGQSLHHPGHVTVIGDVNPGAEIIAGGDVVVWGRLRGIVHAGAGGNDEAIVCALALAPMQLRIGRYISRPPGGEPNQDHAGDITPEIASVQDGQIIVELWGAK
ncbi:MAG: septum site-determining protein MinC [Anaerolineae bacterium]